MPSEERQRKVFTVTELTRTIKGVLENSIGSVWVEGEISNLRQPSSGHCYFTMKDDNAQLTSVMFRGNQTGLRFPLKDGLLIRAQGDITVYEKSGNYQLIVRRMEEGGKGPLQARFEALKKKLQEEGLFEAARKRPIPLLPRHIGVVTSPTGAALRDILNVISRRFPNIHLLIAPVKVQGNEAAPEIAAAIDELNAWGGLDVLIVGRGGGSIEDLWPFNEEVVARAIARSALPIISAVGHETDFTISDFVADLRAPTPSAAAELVVNCKDAFESRQNDAARQLQRAMKQTLLAARHRLLNAATSYVFKEPGNLARFHRQRIDKLRLRMEHTLRGDMASTRQRLDEIGIRMLHCIRMRQQSHMQDVRRLDAQLQAINPLAVLKRGYSVTHDETGQVIRRADQLRPGQRVTTRLQEGRFESDVTRIQEGPHDSKKE
jgi:exodeoxyribonuclease VII large subunit